MTEPILLRISNRLIELYADGELPDAQRRSVENAIRERPELARQAESHRRTTETIHGLYDRYFDAPLPDGIEVLADRLVGRAHGLKQNRRRCIWRAAAALPLAVLVGSAAWWSHQAAPPSSQGAVVGNQLASVESDPVKRVWTTVEAAQMTRGPDLRRFGFELMEIVPPDKSDRKIRLRYRGVDGTALSLYVLRQSQQTEQRIGFVETAPASVLIWHDGAGLFSLVGQTSQKALNDISQVVMDAFSSHRGNLETPLQSAPLDAVNKET